MTLPINETIAEIMGYKKCNDGTWKAAAKVGEAYIFHKQLPCFSTHDSDAQEVAEKFNLDVIKLKPSNYFAAGPKDKRPDNLESLSIGQLAEHSDWGSSTNQSTRHMFFSAKDWRKYLHEIIR